ncbi:MAG: HAD family hydrolase, partial [Phycisphaerae bacterium]|nr:HAD family hydrolase [Phycisphaerae bacterium]
AATRAEVDAFERGFLGVLDDELARAGGLKPVPGAASIFRLVRDAGWTPAVATGCWRRSALRKLDAAGLNVRGIGAAFADDAWPRHEIIRRAVERACALASVDAGCAQPSDVTYVGDGVWDVRACALGGYRFVGIAQGQRAEALRQEGAGTVLANYADERAFLEALHNARAPRKP